MVDIRVDCGNAEENLDEYKTEIQGPGAKSKKSKGRLKDIDDTKWASSNSST